MTKIVINVCHGGYSLSDEAQALLGTKYRLAFEDDRANPQLVAVVEKLGQFACGEYADLKVVEIPDDVEWEVEEYDGYEWVSEKHRRWF